MSAVNQMHAAVFDYIDAHQSEYIQRLREAVAIPSVSAEASRRPDCVRMVEHYQKQLVALGADTEIRELGSQDLPNGGGKIPIAPTLLGKLGRDPNKPTLGVYGHLDVQPAQRSDGWDTEPFELVEMEDGRLCGRGSSDDKGPALGWLAAVEAYQALGVEVPVNLVFCMECMEESGSAGLQDLIIDEADRYFASVQFWCISDNYWLGTRKPCLVYGLRGIAVFHLSVEGPCSDLHSGTFGGAVREPMVDLVALLGTLVKGDGQIVIPGLMEAVAPLTEQEKERYSTIDFDVEGFKRTAGVDQLMLQHARDVLMARWRYPSLSIHGVEGAHAGPGHKSVIPKKVIGKFSIRLVPDQTLQGTEEVVVAHIQKEIAKMKSPNRIEVWTDHGAAAFMSDPTHPNFQAAIEATKQVYGVTPDLIRSGGSIPITLIFQECTKKNVLLLPMGRGDDRNHAQNEKLDKSNFINGIKLMAAYLAELPKVAKPEPPGPPPPPPINGDDAPPKRRKLLCICGNMSFCDCTTC